MTRDSDTGALAGVSLKSDVCTGLICWQRHGIPSSLSQELFQICGDIGVAGSLSGREESDELGNCSSY